MAECENKCHGAKVALAATTLTSVPPPVNICAHPVDKGPCNGLFSRFFFDKEANDCKKFTYGGCGGNGNNFASAMDCQRACQTGAAIAAQPTTTAQRPVHIPNHGPITVLSETRPACPNLEIEACVEPCIVFSNRKGCKECVCPAMDNQPQPPHIATPLSPSISFAKPPATRVPQSPSAPAFASATISQHPAPRVSPSTFVKPMEVIDTLDESVTQAGETLKRPVQPLPIERELSHNKLQTPEQEKLATSVLPLPSSPHQHQFVATSFVQPLATLNPSHVPTQLTEKCKQPVDAGPCEHFVDRWFFNIDDGTCHPFKYGGCAGNRNHFFTQKECEIHCARFGHSEVVTIHSTIAPSTQTTVQFTSNAPLFSVKQTETTTLVTTTSPVPVEPDGAGREPVPSAPIGIGRKMISLDSEELDEPIVTSTTHPPSTRATPVPKLEVFGPPKSHISVHKTHDEVFNAQIVCSLAPDAGRCTNYVPRWFFNGQTGQCEQFSYGSCEGNSNNFLDRATCEVRCLSLHRPTNVLSQIPERCSLDKDSGFGRGYNAKWYFNMKNLRCEQFVYEGQGGNENQFDTLTDCERFCTPRPGNFIPQSTDAASKTMQSLQPVATVVPKVQLNSAATKSLNAPTVPTLPPHTPVSQILNSDESEEPQLSVDYNEANIDVLKKNTLADFSDVSKSVEHKSLEINKPEAPTLDQFPLELLGKNPLPSIEPRPPAAHSVKTEQVNNPPPIPNISEQIDAAPSRSYKAEHLPSVPISESHDQLPIVAPSPPESVNYQTGEKVKTHGIRNFEDKKTIDTDRFDFPEDEPEFNKPPMPACPNGIQEMRYADGRPVMCLPGRNQCPDKSVCFFNGIDYFCCPNEEDPYDKHVFGGYEGEETHQGYKAFGPLRIQKLRHKRQTSFNLDDLVMPLRFDAEKPKQFARAGAVMSSNRRRKQPSNTQAKEVIVASGNIAVCVQELVKGDCSEAHLRYFYDRDSDSCRLFYYSGCKGNGNNFGSLDDCQKTCVLRMKETTIQTVQQTQQSKSTIPIRDVPAGQCPEGNFPLGGPAPVLCGNNTDSIGCPQGYYCRVGPPDVCCPGQDPTKLNLATIISKEVSLASQSSSWESTESTEISTTTVAPHKSFLDVPRDICPDASDPLLGKSGKPLICGAGFDGMKMCPRGYYCAIDSSKGSRLCCPLLAIGSHVPNEQANAPYFGRRTANPGEVIDRGSLPSDQIEFKEKHEDHAKAQFSVVEQSDEFESDSTDTSAPVEETTVPEEETDSAEETVERSEDISDDDEFAHIMMKPNNVHTKKQQEGATIDGLVDPVEHDGVSVVIDKTVDIEETSPVKEVVDKSICHLVPSEGRSCREDETAPRTNLHYFYSAKDKRCKLYFYRGCGGNANRFEKKAACEAMCLP